MQYNGCFMQQHHTCGTGVNRVVHHPTVQNGAIGWVCVSWSVSQNGDFDLPVEIALIDELFGELKTNHDILHPLIFVFFFLHLLTHRSSPQNLRTN